jgi:hypothetical protein
VNNHVQPFDIRPEAGGPRELEKRVCSETFVSSPARKSTPAFLKNKIQQPRRNPYTKPYITIVTQNIRGTQGSKDPQGNTIDLGDIGSVVKKWTKAEHRTFAERFIAFTAATMIFKTVNTCTADAFESINVLRGLVEAFNLAGKHTEVLEDFANFVHNELLIHAASPLSIRQIVCDAAEYEFDYAIAITPDENSFLDRFVIFEHIKKNADKTLNILGQPSYFQSPTV